jgi:hypothetical protein
LARLHRANGHVRPRLFALVRLADIHDLRDVAGDRTWSDHVALPKSTQAPASRPQPTTNLIRFTQFIRGYWQFIISPSAPYTDREKYSSDPAGYITYIAQTGYCPLPDYPGSAAVRKLVTLLLWLRISNGEQSEKHAGSPWVCERAVPSIVPARSRICHRSLC